MSFHGWNRPGRPALALVLWMALAGCSGNGEAPAPGTAATPVRVTEAQRQPLGTSLRTVGTIAPAEEIRLSFKTGGIVAAIPVDAGDRVSDGQLLASLVQEEVAAAVAQARALADKAERDLARGQALYADEVATREQLDDLQTARDVARANLRAAEFNARFSRIEAPTDGIVLRKLVEQDELVAAGQPVIVLGDTSGGWIVRASLSDRDIVRVRAGDKADVTLDAYPGLRFDGTVTELASAADPLTGTYEMKLAIDPQGRKFVQGLVAKVEMAGEPGAAVTVVPVQALLEADGTAAVVYVVATREDRDVAERIAVRIGRLVGDQVEVLDGLQGGERVVTEGAAYLRAGEPVRVVEAG